MTTTDPRSASALFSEVVRARTATEHGRAESSGFMDALLDGRLDREHYARMTAQLYFVYAALEAVGDALAGDPVAAPFVREELRREPALAADLEVLLGRDWATLITATPGTAEYCARIREVGSTWPGGFVAHHYTRYLGDLSGGQVIGAVVRRTYGLERDAGARFYEFPGIPDKQAFKDDYRARLDAAPWDGAEQERVVAEILRAYAHNVAVLADLAPATGAPGPTTGA